MPTFWRVTSTNTGGVRHTGRLCVSWPFSPQQPQPLSATLGVGTKGLSCDGCCSALTHKLCAWEVGSALEVCHRFPPRLTTWDVGGRGAVALIYGPTPFCLGCMGGVKQQPLHGCARVGLVAAHMRANRQPVLTTQFGGHLLHGVNVLRCGLHDAIGARHVQVGLPRDLRSLLFEAPPDLCF